MNILIADILQKKKDFIMVLAQKNLCLFTPMQEAT